MSTPLWTLIALGVVTAAAGTADTDVTAAPKAKGVLMDSAGKEVGTIEAEPVGGGLRVIVKVHDVKPGEHGVHVHSGTSCGTATGAEAFEEAGPHLDPKNTNTHAGLNGTGHGGDLGNISVGGDGKGKLDVVADNLDLGTDAASVVGKPLVLHSQRDNLTNTPENGGSGGRIACGVFERQS